MHTSPDRSAQLAELMTQVSWRLRKGSTKDLAALGITFGPARALRHIARGTEPLRMGDLAARLEVAPRSATALVDTLEAAGLVERTADPQDRRSVLLGATGSGLDLLKAMDRERRASADTLFSALSAVECEQLRRLLVRLLEAEREGER